MKIDKAIKNLKAGRKDCGMIPPEEYTTTIDLAIEALKRCRTLAQESPLWALHPLPGETRD